MVLSHVHQGMPSPRLGRRVACRRCEETDSNWSSGLTIWDRRHGTLRLDVPQDEITVGMPAYLDPADVTLPKVVAMPFQPQRDSWRLPDGQRRTASDPSGQDARQASLVDDDEPGAGGLLTPMSPVR